MMIEPVVLPSGNCAACHNEPEAICLGYYGICEFCGNGAANARIIQTELDNFEDENEGMRVEIEELKDQLERERERNKELNDDLEALQTKFEQMRETLDAG